MDVKLPDGTIVKNVPDGTTKAQLMQKLGRSVDYKVGESARNFGPSVVKAGKEAWNAVTHPVDTGKALLDLGGSALEKVGRNFEEFYSGEEIAPTPGKEDAANAMGQFYKDRYGSVDAFKQTAMDDPAGLMLDASMLVAPARAASKVPMVAKITSTVDPINAIARTGQTAMKVIPEGYAAKLYDSAAKFSNREGFDRNAAIRTAMDEGILPTNKGVRKLENRIQILDATLDDLIAEAGASGMKIPVSAIESHIGELRKTKGGFRLGRGKDVEKIDKILETWHKDLAALGGGGRVSSVSPEFIQKFKQSAYGDVNWNAKRPGAKASRIEEDTYKAMARGAKDAISEAIPEASEINKLLGQLLELQPELIKATGRIDKHNMIGLDTSFKTGAGAAIGIAAGSPGIGTGIGMALSMIGNPRIKPRVALALKRLRDGDVKWIDQNLGDPAVRAAIVLAGRAEEIVGAPAYGDE